MKKRVNYDDLADEYDHRYAGEQRSGTGEALLPLARAIRPARVLEVGCGTGHWREELAGFVPGCIGLDFSLNAGPGRAVLDDPFLKKKSCSQLALLDDETYAAGIRRLKAKLARAEATGEMPVFRSEIDLELACGWK